MVPLYLRLLFFWYRDRGGLALDVANVFIDFDFAGAQLDVFSGF